MAVLRVWPSLYCGVMNSATRSTALRAREFTRAFSFAIRFHPQKNIMRVIVISGWLSAPTSKHAPARTCWFAFLSVTSATRWPFACMAFSPCSAWPAVARSGPGPHGQPSPPTRTGSPSRRFRTSRGHASHGNRAHVGAGCSVLRVDVVGTCTRRRPPAATNTLKRNSQEQRRQELPPVPSAGVSRSFVR